MRERCLAHAARTAPRIGPGGVGNTVIRAGWAAVFERIATANRVVLGRVIAPVEVVALVTLPTADGAAMTIGTDRPVDGGMLKWSGRAALPARRESTWGWGEGG